MIIPLFDLRGTCNKVKKQSRYFIIFIGLLLLNGCGLLPDLRINTVNYNHYYLWIKSLNDEEVVQEISRQKNNKLSGVAQADIHLIMLFSLPNSPVHNPYTAKTQLNDYQLEPYEETIFSTTDLAFVVMLKDQLNQQLLILEELNNYKGAYKQSKKMIAEQQVEISEAQKIITQLNQKIIQLKKIEKAISEHGK